MSGPEEKNNSNDLSLYDLPLQFGSSRKNYYKNSFGQKTKKQNNLFLNAEKTTIRKHDLFDHPHKMYCFTSDSNLKTLPSPDNLFCDERWVLPVLQDLKNELNSVKSELNDYKLEDWHKHTKFTYKAAEVLPHLKKTVKPELLTQAWCKFYEILNRFSVVPDVCRQEHSLNSVHLCEAPGAFVASLNHFLSTSEYHRYTKWNWLAVTLNPYHEQNSKSEMINDDRLIFHTLTKWNFGADETGNIQNVENMEFLVEKAREKFQNGVMLVTGDGSIDCTLNPAEQESIVAPLFYCEAIAALRLLRSGGTLVLKLFTLFECETICLLYLLNCSFESISLYKPFTSKDGNSEVYLVCSKYIPTKELLQLIPKLTSNYGPNVTRKSLFKQSDIPESFMSEVIKAAELFQQEQANAIRSNIDRFNRMTDEEKSQLQSLQEEFASEFVDFHKLRKCNSEIVGKYRLRNVPTLFCANSFDEGTYNEHMDRLNSLSSCLNYMKKQVLNLTCCWPYSTDVYTFSSPHKLTKVTSKFGKPVNVVNSSKFCLSSLLETFNKINKLLDKTHFANDCCKLSSTVESDSSICDVSKEFLGTCIWLAQKVATEFILQKLGDMKPGDSFKLIGLPLLTQYNVSLIFLLSHIFHSTTCFNPSGSTYSIQFEGFIKERFDQPCMDDVMKNIANSNEKSAVLTFFPITQLCENSDFFNCIAAMNHICLKEYILRHIHMIT